MNSNHIVIENNNKLFSWCSNNNGNIEEIMKVIDDIYSKILSFDDKDFFYYKSPFISGSKTELLHKINQCKKKIKYHQIRNNHKINIPSFVKYFQQDILKHLSRNHLESTLSFEHKMSSLQLLICSCCLEYKILIPSQLQKKGFIHL